MRTSSTVWALAGMVAVCLTTAAQGQDTQRTPRFSEVVTERFDAWDADRDGRLSPTEIDRACVNPAIHGPEAAAIAALKRIIRSEKYELPALTKDYLAKPSARGTRRPAPAGDTDRDDSTEKTFAHNTDQVPATAGAGLSAADLQSRYVQCLSRIEKTDRSLFKGNSDLTIEHCHQGPLGDCFFVSVVGGMVRRDASAIRSMITPAGDEGYDVRFGNGRTIRVAALTDAEVAISSTTADRTGDIGGEGLWLAVLEKAFGTLRITDSPQRFSSESATDAIAKGGSTGSSIQLLTGHRTERITLKRPIRGWKPDEMDRNKDRSSGSTGTIVPTEPAGDLDSLERKVRSSIEKALDDGRLVATGTGEERQPPGMSTKHAYAVLAFDAAGDRVTIWNPHGNSFRPRGEPGMTNGYVTKAGVFTVSVHDFVRLFNGVTIETDRTAGRSLRS